ncbi:uncharacterized protein LOC135697495 [Ochlerotatus camptorhynchus]|uniref:uncharacterized protein LOC135697495 n=1 Tax=Ochlerotatus camptorhynchus TaxID=644619 RepID=UPI0031D581B5
MLDQQQPVVPPLDQLSNYDIYSQLQMVADSYTNFPGPSPAVQLEDGPAVLGFTFPLALEDDVERLEIAVKQSSLIRGQYVQLLNITKPIQMTIVQSFNKFFSDYSMTNFSYYGVERAEYPKTPKKGMKKYDIFTLCMLDAWQSHGITSIILMEQLKKAIYHISRRRYTRNQVLKKKMKLMHRI